MHRVGTLGLGTHASFRSDSNRHSPAPVIVSAVPAGAGATQRWQAAKVRPSGAFSSRIRPAGRRGLFASWRLAQPGRGRHRWPGRWAATLTATLSPAGCWRWNWRVHGSRSRPACTVPLCRVPARHAMPETAAAAPRRHAANSGITRRAEGASAARIIAGGAGRQSAARCPPASATSRHDHLPAISALEVIMPCSAVGGHHWSADLSTVSALALLRRLVVATASAAGRRC